MTDKNDRGRTSAEERVLVQATGEAPLWQDLVAAVGAVLVLAVLGFLAWELLTTTETPPAIVVRAEAVEPQPGGYLVRFEARNDGGSTAAGAEIVGRLREGATLVEEARVTLDYLPARSSRAGGLLFARDPRGLELRLQAEGYSEP